MQVFTAPYAIAHIRSRIPMVPAPQTKTFCPKDIWARLFAWTATAKGSAKAASSRVTFGGTLVQRKIQIYYFDYKYNSLLLETKRCIMIVKSAKTSISWWQTFRIVITEFAKIILSNTAKFTVATRNSIFNCYHISNFEMINFFTNGNHSSNRLMTKY